MWIYIYCILFKSLYLPQSLCNRRPIFTTLHDTISLYISIFWCFAQAWCQCYKVRYLIWFKTATSSRRSVQIASNSECIWRCLVAIDLFCSLFCIQSVMEIQLCKGNAHFSRSFRANNFGKPCPIQCMGKLLA